MATLGSPRRPPVAVGTKDRPSSGRRARNCNGARRRLSRRARPRRAGRRRRRRGRGRRTMLVASALLLREEAMSSSPPPPPATPTPPPASCSTARRQPQGCAPRSPARWRPCSPAAPASPSWWRCWSATTRPRLPTWRARKRAAARWASAAKPCACRRRTSEAELLALVERLNGDDTVDGILVQLPLPAAIDERKVLERVDPDKDVDGFHAVNVGRLWQGEKALGPATPSGWSRC